MSRFFVSKDNVKNNKIYIDGKEAHHILDVMRLKKGDSVTVFDSSAKEHTGQIIEAAPKSLVVSISSTRDLNAQRPAVRITLVQGIPKKEKMDFIVQKAAELGASVIVPVITDRSISRPKDDKGFKVKRWRDIAKEAAKQCCRPDVPQVENIKSFKDSMDLIKKNDFGLIASLVEGARPIRDCIKDHPAKDVILFIGPEGDFTEREVRSAEGLGCCTISLGKLVLKSDTAAIYALSVLNYELNNL